MTTHVIRRARDEDGPVIGQLFRDVGLADLGVDWSRGIDNWIVAECKNVLVGAIQAIPARPFGWIGDIVVTPHMQGREASGRGRLGRRPGTIGFALYVVALDYLQAMGCQVALGMTDKPGLVKILMHYGAINLGPQTMLARNLASWRGFAAIKSRETTCSVG